MEQRACPPIHLPLIRTTKPNGTQIRVAIKSTKITLSRSRLCHVRRRGLVCMIKHEKMLPVVDITKITAKTIVSITTRWVGRCSKSFVAFQLLMFRSLMLRTETLLFYHYQQTSYSCCHQRVQKKDAENSRKFYPTVNN